MFHLIPISLSLISISLTAIFMLFVLPVSENKLTLTCSTFTGTINLLHFTTLFMFISSSCHFVIFGFSPHLFLWSMLACLLACFRRHFSPKSGVSVWLLMISHEQWWEDNFYADCPVWRNHTFEHGTCRCHSPLTGQQTDLTRLWTGSTGCTVSPYRSEPRHTCMTRTAWHHKLLMSGRPRLILIICIINLLLIFKFFCLKITELFCRLQCIRSWCWSIWIERCWFLYEAILSVAQWHIHAGMATICTAWSSIRNCHIWPICSSSWHTQLWELG